MLKGSVIVTAGLTVANLAGSQKVFSTNEKWC
jgi:hypothetical protein